VTGLLPILPEKATAGLTQLNVPMAGESLDELFEPLGIGRELGRVNLFLPGAGPETGR